MGEGIFYPEVSGDDGYWYSSGIGASGLNTTVGDIGAPCHSWFRFANVTIPTGMVITSAFVRFTSYNSRSSSPVNVDIHCNDIGDSIAPTTYEEAFALELTLAIPWYNLGAWVNGSTYDTPSLISILQAVIDRVDWVSDNSIQVILKDSGSTGGATRSPSAIDYLSGTEKAELHVTWDLSSTQVIVDVKTYIEAVRSKWWLNTDIQAKYAHGFKNLLSEIQAGSIFLTDLISEINTAYPTREKFLLLRYDHVPARDATNVQIGKAMKFRLYNPDPLFGIDLTTFKIRFNEGTWYRYGDSRLTFTEVTYREYLVYFNPPTFDYDSQVDVELYCEDYANNPGIKLEIL